MKTRTITQAILCAINTADGAPEIIQVLPVGDVVGRDGRKWKCTNPNTVIQNAELPVCADYDHQTELPLKGQSTPTIAAGWISELIVQDGHICARIEWTPNARQKIIDKEYTGISPAFLVKNGEIIKLTSVGLTNKPNLALSALNSEDGNMEFLQKLAALLGLTPEQTTEDSVYAGVKALIEEDKNEPPATPPAVNSTEYVKRADYEKVISSLAEKDTRLNKLESASIEAAVCEAEKAGKCYPFEHEMNVKLCKSEGVDAFRALMDKRPQLNVTQEVAGDASKPPPAQQGSLTPEEVQVCRIRNISEEEFLKARGVA